MYHLRILAGIASLVFLFGCSSSKIKPDAGNQPNQSQPKLTKPVARKIWIEPQVIENGSVYVEGHWKYVIEKESSWTN